MPQAPFSFAPHMPPNRQTTHAARHDGFEETPSDFIRRSITGNEIHKVPFRKRELEAKSGVDHKPSSDNLFDIRHTKVYEDVVEKQNVAKHLPMQKVATLSKPLTKKIEESHNRCRANSDDLSPKGGQKGEGKKRRNSINKKLKKGQSLMNNDVDIGGSGFTYEMGSMCGVSSLLESKFIQIDYDLLTGLISII
jgi:hypothetical protein